ncbi:ATP-binding protein [Polyangium jinanense]|uniref:histidine kinase n=1 Tax=Polyangium jinanense TaxID=2829994 RepID=A0A9X3XG74_9BACT|nr:ATP-binding protein [Polyangium jinanense]MDC3961635.1 PAS domain-containing protein [Polyangium jinanense]MDC3988143.1 PAS domain-containing protein [Polyangium jinanense]
MRSLVVGALVVGLFLLDLTTSLGVVIPFGYVVPVCIALWLPRRGAAIFVVGVCTLLTALGFLVSPNPYHVPPWIDAMMRTSTLAVLWLSVAFGVQWRRAAERMLEAAAQSTREVAERRRVQEAQEAQNAHLRLLAKAAGRLVLSDEPVELLGPLFTELGAELGVELYFNYMTGPVPETLELESSAGLTEEQRTQYHELKFGEFLCGTVAETGKPLILADLQHSTYPGSGPLKGVGVQAYAGFPLVAHGRVLGTLAFATSRRTRYTDDELRLMQTLSDQVAAVIDRGELVRKLKESERAAQRHLAELQSVYKTSPAGLCVLDTEFRYVNINETLARYNGTSVAAHIGRTIWEMVPGVAGPIAAVLRHVFETGENSMDHEYRMETAGQPGVLRDWIASFVPIKDASGTVQGVNVMVQEVTRLKQIERALREAGLALREADRRKDEFLAMLGHELRNPLAPIRTAVKVLDMRAGRSPEARQTLAMIERQVAHMARMIDDLLDVSRISRGKLELRKEPCDVAQIVRDVAHDYASIVSANGLTLSVALPEEPRWVEGDPTRLSQVVGNLLHNAIKFTDPGGRIHVQMDDDAATNEVSIMVSDTGIGMDAPMLGRLFETFSQADRSLDRSRGGLGLGLAVVKGLVELHGGAVEAHSAGLGKGSTLRVRLPLSTEAALGAAAPSTPLLRQTDGPLRILVIEDNRDTADILRNLLVLLGYRAEVAYTGPAGIEAAKRLRPDVVLCDLGLPDMDGFAVARALRAMSVTASSHLIAQTGYGGAEDRRRTLAAGFDAHMTKPIDPAELERVLSSVAEMRRERPRASPRRQARRSA